MGKILFAGPWTGEFGWEIMAWQAHVRHLAKEYDRVVVCSRPGHQVLYEDFCDEYIEHAEESLFTSCWQNKAAKYEGILGHISKYKKNDNQVEWKDPRVYCQQYTQAHRASYNATLRFIPGEFVKLGKYTPTITHDLLFHARTRKVGNYANWSKENWKTLTKTFPDLKIASVGSIAESMHVEGTEDLRGIPLAKLADIYASAKLVVGPTSGGMHFASLCGVPHFVWGQFRKNRPRFETLWNPFQTPVTVILPKRPDDGPDIHIDMDDQRWRPGPKTVASGIRKMLAENSVKIP